MTKLEHKIDFALVFAVHNANPNGDPLDGNRPRTTYDGFGEVSDVCLKRKIRNRLLDLGENVFVQSDDRRNDEYRSLRERADAVPELKSCKDKQKYAQLACARWIDVRVLVITQTDSNAITRKNANEHAKKRLVKGISVQFKAIFKAEMQRAICKSFWAVFGLFEGSGAHSTILFKKSLKHL